MGGEYKMTIPCDECQSQYAVIVEQDTMYYCSNCYFHKVILKRKYLAKSMERTEMVNNSYR